MSRKYFLIFFYLPVVLLCYRNGICQSVRTSVSEQNGVKIFSLSNKEVIQQVFIKNDVLAGDVLKGQSRWLAKYNSSNDGVVTDGNYALKMMWADWSAPGRKVNANVAITFTKKDYRFQSYRFTDLAGGGKELELFFVPFNPQNTVDLKLTYQLLSNKFYAKRQIAVRDTIIGANWLDQFISREGNVSSAKWGNGNNISEAHGLGSANYSVMETNNNTSPLLGEKIIKRGAFGQPCGIELLHGGVFFGIEYPAATTTVLQENRHLDLRCQEIIGSIVKKDWVNSKWVVEGLTPNHYVREWFFKYLPDIKYTPDKPYALYNTWYDMRSPKYKNLSSQHILNEKNIMTIIHEFKKNMIDPYSIHLNAFVLDDGWDKHHSDWQLRKSTFPNGLTPISDALKPLGTTLGIWYGPTGGYAFRQDRIGWMHDHGYEVTGNDMMCIAGKKYSALFKELTTNMVRNDGVGYFKWDGIQFSCSDPSHGHPIGIYSRRAILDSVYSDVDAVRKINPNAYFNITSGTWLSPWWLEKANQIWMQGGDFGFADIPVVNQRDASMTYKDIVLYNDFHNLDDWFPISNLMTHGIIKGVLNEIGGVDDPLNKFTDDAMFYFGRGVTMYELYISPDLLNKGEWNALSKSLKWAENRFPILDHTFMTGGDPAKGHTYGYVHYNGNKGIIAVRNPEIKNQYIEIKLSAADGMNPGASSLVFERVYPSHWISPNLYSTGATIDIPLDGYESAVYEVYPIDSAQKPLLAGVTFKVKSESGQHAELDLLDAGTQVKLLNSDFISDVKIGGKSDALNSLSVSREKAPNILISKSLSFNGSTVSSELGFAKDDITPRFIVFLHPDSAFQGKAFPDGKLIVDGKEVRATKQEQKGAWSVYSFMLPEKESTGEHTFSFKLIQNNQNSSWSGKAKVWLITQQTQPVQKVSIETKEDIKVVPMPPSPFQKDAIKRIVELGEGPVSLQ